MSGGQRVSREGLRCRSVLALGLVVAACGESRDATLPETAARRLAISAVPAAEVAEPAAQLPPDEELESAEGGAEVRLPARLVEADLPEGATVRCDHGLDFDVYWISLGDRPLVGLYLGNHPHFPGHETGADEIERREESRGVTTVSVTRGTVLVARERLFDSWAEGAPRDWNGSTANGKAAPLATDPPLDVTWCDTLHVFTWPTAREDASGNWQLIGIPRDALALFESVAPGPALRAAWSREQRLGTDPAPR